MRLKELWEHVREGDLSHSLEPPSCEAIAAGTAWLLLVLKGKEVIGLLSAERLSHATQLAAAGSWTPPPVAVQKASSAQDWKSSLHPRVCLKDVVPAAAEVAEVRTPSPRARRASRNKAALGVALIWVRRSERRRGFARALVDATRKIAALGSPGSVDIRASEVAFSQPTDLGLAFASSYVACPKQAAAPLIYEPTW